MSASTFFISQASVRHLKTIAIQMAEKHTHNISSSHLSEGIAAALGFKTHAALRAALAENSTTQAIKPVNTLLTQRSQQLGYANIPNDLHLLPELNISYTPFKRFSLKKHRGVRWMAWRNLLVSAINAGIEQKLFGLSPDENWWPGAKQKQDGNTRGTYHFMFDGKLPAIASVTVTSGDELSINVILNPRNGITEPSEFSGLDDADACAHGWLERRLGVWIQDGGENFSCKRSVHSLAAAATVEPMGYSDQGSFIM